MKIKTFVAVLTFLPFYVFGENNLAFQQYYQGDYVAAATSLETLVQNKNNEAAFYLGTMYLQGYGVKKNAQQGLDLILQAAKQNYVPAQVYLAQYYLVENNKFDDAFYWFQKAADLGNVEAQIFCATSYLYGYGVPQSTEKARKYIIKAAQSGDPLAQFELGKFFLNSKKVKDQELGLLWLNKAAEKGNRQAQYFLGASQLTANKTTQNVSQGLKWINAAATKGNEKARFALAVYYLTSNSNPENMQLATYWFNKNLQSGDDVFLDNNQTLNTEVQNNNDPKIFLNTKNAAKNGEPTTFKDWLRLAEQGDINAAQQVGYQYAKGEGISFNKDLGLKWLTRAADANNYVAKIQLAALQNKWSNIGKSQQSVLLTPKMAILDKAQVFNQDYQLVDPEQLPINELINTLGKLNYQSNPQFVVPTLKLTAAQKKKLKTSLKEITRQANLGYPQAQYKLGLMYLKGIGVKKDIPEAIKLFELSAKQNYLKAEYALGVLAFAGRGMPQDHALAQSWLNKAALKGSANAQLFLAQLYESGYGNAEANNEIPQNLETARVMYGLAATNENTQAQYKLAQLYISGLLAKGDLQAQQKSMQIAYELFKQASIKNPNAKLMLGFFNLDKKQSYKDQETEFMNVKTYENSDNTEAKLLLALMYDRGVGTAVNKEKAAELYQQLAKEGNSIAQYMLGCDYALGIGVEKNPTLARMYLAEASTAGLGYANYNLAVLDYQQNNVASFLVLLKLAQERDYQPASILLADYYLTNQIDSAYTKQAVSIYESLANSGNTDAQIKLAYMYQNGIYFSTDYQAALDWYQKAASNNSPLAQFALGEMYQLGQGTVRDLQMAMNWYEKAAKQQYAPAQVALGYINEVDWQNYHQARSWYELAAAKDHCPIADYNLALLYDYGKGVPVDEKKAKAFYERAANQGLQALN